MVYGIIFVDPWYTGTRFGIPLFTGTSFGIPWFSNQFFAISDLLEPDLEILSLLVPVFCNPWCAGTSFRIPWFTGNSFWDHWVNETRFQIQYLIFLKPVFDIQSVIDLNEFVESIPLIYWNRFKSRLRIDKLNIAIYIETCLK